MAAKKPTLGPIHEEILSILKLNPEGVGIYEIREKLKDIEIQQHLDKRVRELRTMYNIHTKRKGKVCLYIYGGEREDAITDDGSLSGRMRAAILHAAHGRCQMCGKTVEEDNIKLQIDHKIPRDWGGLTTLENLWAICQPCNGGKKNYFASFDIASMKGIMSLEGVHERIAELLRMHQGKPVSSELIEFVANIDDGQEDWQKRLRELRYPCIGMKIISKRVRNKHGKWKSTYTLEESIELPSDYKMQIKKHERKN